MASIALDFLLDELNRLGRYQLRCLSRIKFQDTIIFLRNSARCVEMLTLESDQNTETKLGSLLYRIEDKAYNFAENISGFPYTGWTREAYDFLRKSESFQAEIYEFFMNLLDTSSKSSPRRRGEVVGFMDFLTGILMDRLSRGSCLGLEDLIEALVEKLIFLKNLIQFAMLQRGVEDRELDNLLTHARIVVIDAAGIFTTSGPKNSNKIVGVENRIFKVLEKIRPVDHKVRQTYIQVLKTSNLSGLSHSRILETDKHIVEDFLDSLLGFHWELLNCDTSFTVSVKDQMENVYWGLRFLRTTLRVMKDQMNEQETKDLIKLVISEAGIVICSLCGNKMKAGLTKEINLALSNLLEKIKHIKAEVTEKYPISTTYGGFPKTNELGFLDSFLESLKELECLDSSEHSQIERNLYYFKSLFLSNRNCKSDSFPFSKDQIQTVRKDIEFLRSLLEDIVEQRNHHEKLQALWNRVMEVAYKAEFIIDSLVVNRIPIFSPLLPKSITEEIKLIKTETAEIYDSKSHDNEAQKITKIYSQMPSYYSIPRINEVVVGFDDEAESIIDQLTRGSTQLDIVSIVGMPGLGKTTLAQKVYNNVSIVRHFHIRAWGYVSQIYSKRNLLLGLLNYFDSDKNFEMDEEDLAEKLYKCLKGKRYLVVLDDLWEIAVWNDLQILFPNDSNGSRILFTSRHQSMALQAKLNGRPLVLSPLTEEKSWELFQKKLFQEEGCPADLCELGMQIAKDCKGVPLTIVLVVGILARKEQDGWKEIAESVSSGIVCHTEEGMTTLELSYKNLPDYLKPCFLYFGAFPGGQEISVQKLIRLWLAEGFVQQNESKNLDEVAEDYMMDLIGRSLVMVSNERYTGEVKTCRLHDLLHEFCVMKAKEECFLQVLHGYDEICSFDGPSRLRRLCIYSTQEHFKKSRLYCPQVRCLLFSTYGHKQSTRTCNISFVFRIFKLLRVLDLIDIDVGRNFPSEIEFLVQLTYLAFGGGKICSVPSSIAHLSNLQTFVLKGSWEGILLPDAIWSMKKLRHIHCATGYFKLPSDNPQNSYSLYNLDSFCTIVLHVNTSKILRNFPNIRTLRCCISNVGYFSDSNRAMELDFLSRLGSLELFSFGWVKYDIEFCLPLNLKKLILSGFQQPWSKISTIGALPNLEFLELVSQAFMGEEWEMKEGQFPKLKFLKLGSSNIVRWTGSDDNLPCLHTLVLQYCEQLEEIPSCFGCIATLEVIEVWNCPEPVQSLVRDVQEEQIGTGNDSLEVFIYPPQSENTSS